MLDSNIEYPASAIELFTNRSNSERMVQHRMDIEDKVEHKVIYLHKDTLYHVRTPFRVRIPYRAQTLYHVRILDRLPMQASRIQPHSPASFHNMNYRDCKILFLHLS